MKGNERNWWSEETLEAFERKTKCLKEQYSNLTFDGGTVWRHNSFSSSFRSFFSFLLKLHVRRRSLKEAVKSKYITDDVVL